MERLIVIGFRHGDIVFKPAFNRNPHRVDDTKYRVTLNCSITDYSYSQYIVDFINLFLSLLYLHVDRVGMLYSTGDFYVL